MLEGWSYLPLPQRLDSAPRYPVLVCCVSEFPFLCHFLPGSVCQSIMPKKLWTPKKNNSTASSFSSEGLRCFPCKYRAVRRLPEARSARISWTHGGPSLQIIEDKKCPKRTIIRKLLQNLQADCRASIPRACQQRTWQRRIV